MPFVDKSGKITFCAEIDSYDNCKRVGYIYSPSSLNPNSNAGKKIKVWGETSNINGACTLKACSDGCCNNCFGGKVFITDGENRFENIELKDGSYSLRCGGNECDIKCDSPFEEDQVYVFEGKILNGIKYNSNNQPYTISTFYIEDYEKFDGYVNE